MKDNKKKIDSPNKPIFLPFQIPEKEVLAAIDRFVPGLTPLGEIIDRYPANPPNEGAD